MLSTLAEYHCSWPSAGFSASVKGTITRAPCLNGPVSVILGPIAPVLSQPEACGPP